jgi:hypothetical protein
MTVIWFSLFEWLGVTAKITTRGVRTEDCATLLVAAPRRPPDGTPRGG